MLVWYIRRYESEDEDLRKRQRSGRSPPAPLPMQDVEWPGGERGDCELHVPAARRERQDAEGYGRISYKQERRNTHPLDRHAASVLNIYALPYLAS